MNVNTGEMRSLADLHGEYGASVPAEWAPLPRHLSRKAALALAVGRRFPDPQKDRALSKHAAKLKKARRRMAEESRRRNRRK